MNPDIMFSNNKVIQIALHGLENILKVGDAYKQAAGDTPGAINRYALFIDPNPVLEEGRDGVAAGPEVAITRLRHVGEGSDQSTKTRADPPHRDRGLKVVVVDLVVAVAYGFLHISSSRMDESNI
ncbi:hypothetical protein F5883DRAFT_621955 [Diaporthe sp. PMI_573]|nr:hypothetical protein F5883DRAFT_621955 [Diaporthaceae sp. PMI_573]